MFRELLISMVHGGIHGPAGMPRPLCRCNQQIVFVLVGRGNDIDETAIENELDTELSVDVSVNSRGPKIEGDRELVVTVRSGSVSENTVDESESVINSYLITQNVGFEIKEWRIDST